MKRTIRYVCLYALFLAVVIAGKPLPASGGIQIEGLKVKATTRTLEITFDGPSVTSIKNLATGEQYIVKPRSFWLQVKLLEGGDIRPDTAPVGWRVASDPQFGSIATIELGESAVEIRMQVGVDPARDEVFVRIRGKLSDNLVAEPGVISALWGIGGLSLNPGRLVIPAQAGTYFDLHSQPDLIGLDYPVHWEHGFVVYESGQGGFLLYANDPRPFFKRLHASRQTGNLDMAVELFAQAPWKKAREVPEHEWRLSGFQGDWRTAALQYKDWLASVRPNVTPDAGRAWIKGIRGVVTLQTLDPQVLDTLAEKLVADKTLLYLVDWRKDAFDLNYPDYTPGAKTKDFVDRAHALGFRVMVHVNLLGVSPLNSNYPSMKEFQIRNGSDLGLIGWLWDRAEDDPFRIAYISPASSAYRRLLLDSIRPAVDGLHLDALHLDAGGAIVNDGNGLIEGMTSIEGMMQLQRDLLQEFPNLVLGSESTNEVIAPFDWIAQRWTSDSPAHPISTFMLGDQVRFYGFLDQPIADYPQYIDFVKRYEGQGILPTVHVTQMLDLAPDRTRTQDLISQMRSWEDSDFEPDWNTPWEDRLFVFRGADGRQAEVEGDEHRVRLRFDGNVHYERVRNASEVETQNFITNWPAYDSERLYGLNADRQYWIEPNGHRPEGLIHLRELPPNVTVGLGSLVTPDYGYFELPVSESKAQQFNFVESFKDTQSGTIYNGRDYPLIYGASATIQSIAVGGQLAPQVLMIAPPFRGPAMGGAVYVDYRIAVPQAHQVSLAFDAGLADGTVFSDGVLMVLRINGEERWRATVQADGWHPVNIDISSYAGADITVRLIAHPGIRGNPFLDWACWSNIRVIADLSRPDSSLSFEVPAPNGTESVSKNASFDLTDGTTGHVRLNLPGSFVFFAKPPQPVALQQSLLDLNFDVWRADRDGLPYLHKFETSGEVGAATAGGVEKKKALSARPARDSVTIATFPVHLPNDATRLSFSVGLTDPPSFFGGPANYSGVKMSIRINDVDVWFSDELRLAQWTQTSVDLGDWAGQDVLIQLSSNSLGAATFDWAEWADLIVE